MCGIGIWGRLLGRRGHHCQNPFPLRIHPLTLHFKASSSDIDESQTSETPRSHSPSVIDPVPTRSTFPFSTTLYSTLPGGSANQHSTFPPLFSTRYRVTPASVPPVPVAQMKASSFPPLVCSHISGPVVAMWAPRLAVLSNWLVQTALSSESA